MDKTAKERMKRYRNKQRNETVTESVDSVTVSVTEGVESVTPRVHPIVYALADPEKRLKLRSICEELKRKTNRLDSLYYGGGRDMLPFTEVDRLLEAFD